jgi:predicted dehydrogenase
LLDHPNIMNKRTKIDRRGFLKASGVAGVGIWAGTGFSTGTGFWTGTTAVAGSPTSLNEKLNIGVIGCGGKGYSDMINVSTENIVALCDVDSDQAAKAFAEMPNATRYHDFRDMLDKEKLDAVTVSTPDHVHAAASIMAMRKGLHVFTQKPLTHDIGEAYRVLQVARETGVATQMGNQGTARPGFRRGVEVLRSGALGAVRQFHVWTNRPIWPQGMNRPQGYKSVPKNLHWDTWLGPARWRPFHDGYCPFVWRGWWDFGTGAMGDMACHTCNLAFMGLDLTAPTAVEVIRAVKLNHDTGPTACVLRYEFPARGEGTEPIEFYWYEGGFTPPTAIMEPLADRSSGCAIIGDEGKMVSPDDYGGVQHLLPHDKFADFEDPEPTLPRSAGHALEWLEACRGGPPALSNFAHAAPFTAAMLVGNLALRAGAPRIEWDAENMRVTNVPEANRFVSSEYRPGYS